MTNAGLFFVGSLIWFCVGFMWGYVYGRRERFKNPPDPQKWGSWPPKNHQGERGR